MNTAHLLRQAVSLLEEAGCDAPRLDAELLLMHLWHVERTDLVIRAHDEVPEEVEKAFQTLLQRRMNREPLAYITGEKEFWSRPFLVTPDVLIPRPETEHLIEALMEYLPEKGGSYTFCDIGTGSGCIAATLACEYPQSHIVATDISEAALSVVQSNAVRLGVGERISFCSGDMLHALSCDNGPFDAIISNPPYVADREMITLEAELSHEPRGALTDESDGLKFLTTILNEAPQHLKPKGFIIVETGTCGLPSTPDNLTMKEGIYDLAGHLRGGIYQHKEEC